MSRHAEVEIISPSKFTMTYIEAFEAEFLKRLNTEEEIALLRWVSEEVLKSYRNGITAGQKGVQVKRSGMSRRYEKAPRA